MSVKPKIVVLCGSSRFVSIMAVCAWLIERDERAIAMGLHLLPEWYPNCPDHHLAEHEGVSMEMDTLHLRKIDLCDEVFVVDWDGYVGLSTSNEIAHARALGKPVRMFREDRIGTEVCRMLIAHGEAQRKPGTRPLRLRIPRPAFEAIEATAHRMKITVDALASRMLVDAMEDDGVWTCSACGEVLGKGTPRNYGADVTRPVCPGCADVGVVEHADGAVERCECAGAAQAVPVVVHDDDGEAD